VWVVLFEAEWLGEFSVFIDKLNSVFFGEVARLHFVQQADSLDCSVTKWDQRFAYVEAWEVIAFEDRDSVASLG
jgi:hypothetical protein